MSHAHSTLHMMIDQVMNMADLNSFIGGDGDGDAVAVVITAIIFYLRLIYIFSIWKVQKKK